MAERLGNGLQNHVHRFESGSDLTKNLKRKFGVFLCSILPILPLYAFLKFPDYSLIFFALAFNYGKFALYEKSQVNKVHCSVVRVFCSTFPKRSMRWKVSGRTV